MKLPQVRPNAGKVQGIESIPEKKKRMTCQPTAMRDLALPCVCAKRGG